MSNALGPIFFPAMQQTLPGAVRVSPPTVPRSEEPPGTDNLYQVVLSTFLAREAIRSLLSFCFAKKKEAKKKAILPKGSARQKSSTLLSFGAIQRHGAGCSAYRLPEMGLLRMAFAG